MFQIKIFDETGKRVNAQPEITGRVGAFIAGLQSALPTYTIHASVVPHICSRHATEVTLSDCSAGCKVMACTVCKATGTVHSRIYGCRNTQAR